MIIKTKDKIVQRVLAKMDQRSLVGQKKYGATMMEEIEGQKKDLNRFFNRCTRRIDGCFTIYRSC